MESLFLMGPTPTSLYAFTIACFENLEGLATYLNCDLIFFILAHLRPRDKII